MVYEAEGHVGVTGVEAGVRVAEVIEAGAAEELGKAGVVEEVEEEEVELIEEEVEEEDKEDLMIPLLKLSDIKGNVM